MSLHTVLLSPQKMKESWPEEGGWGEGVGRGERE